MLSLVTNTILDVSFGLVYWVSKKTIWGLWSGLSYIFWTEEQEKCNLDNEGDYILMSDFNMMLREKNDEINKLKTRIDQLNTD